MSDIVFEQLADALDKLPNGFPRTPSKIEIRILKKIFSPGEAALASQLGGSFEPMDEIAKRNGLPVEQTRKQLLNLVRHGMVWLDKGNGRPRVRLAPFIVGIYEAQLELMDHELAHLVEDYLVHGGAQGIMRPQPALHRVLPAGSAVKTEWVLPYDDVRAILLSAKTFHLNDCICRLQQDQLGSRKCDFPVNMCLGFSDAERPAVPGDVSREEALSILEKSEQVGLVHTVSNVMQGVGYVCNCCGCCCAILRSINEWGIENSVAYANYFAVIDPEICAGCGDCIKRCQVHAISAGEDVSVVDQARCIGCGLCVTGCSNQAARLERKAEAGIIHPPVDFADWEQRRLQNRGLGT
ncbi:MAG: 4Fe-4S binding protein [Chloroflexi bacterium]|nr:4Fe-4S binding protein [Chloroflexota bacterium]